MTPPALGGNSPSVALTDCFQQRAACQEANRLREEDTRKLIAANHEVTMKELGVIKDYMAEKRGEERALAKTSTNTSHPVARRSFAQNMGAKILEWVIITAITGGLFAYLKHEQSIAAQPAPAPAASAKP